MKKIIALVLMLSMLFSLLAVPMGTLAQEKDNNLTMSQLLAVSSEDETTESEDGRVWFQISEENGANSKLFVEYDSDEYKTLPNAESDWVPCLDFVSCPNRIGTSYTNYEKPTGVFDDDLANIYVMSEKQQARAFVYEIDADDTNKAKRTANFTTKNGKTVWTIAGVNYEVNPTDKAISLMNNIDTSEVTDAGLKAHFETMAGVTLEVTDGYYETIGFLAGCPTNNRHFKITPIYKDDKGIANSENVQTTTTALSTTAGEGAIKVDAKYILHDWGNAPIAYHPVTFTIENDRELDKVLIQSGGNALPVSIISAWGEKAGISDFISLIEEIMADGINNLDEYKSVKNYMSIIAADGGVMTDAQKAVYDNTILALAAFEANLEEMEKEAERQEAMSKRTYNYLTLAADRDVFVTWKDVTDLSRFQYDAAGTNKTVPDGFNTATYDFNGTTIFDWIPHVRADGTTKITGKEYYYYKGFKNVALPELSENEAERGGAPASPEYAYLADDITGENGTSVAGKRVAGISSSSNYGSDEYYAGTDGVARATTDTKKTVKNPEFAQPLDEDGYFIIKKNAESKTLYKIGPVLPDSYAPNAQIVGSSINNVNVKGTTLDLLITATGINYNSTYYKTANSAIGAAPVAALQQVTLTYEDGETDTKYVVITDNKLASYNGMYAENSVLKTIVFAPKYEEDGVTEIKYDQDSFYANKADYDFKILKGNTATVELTDTVSADDVSFENPDIVMASNASVAQVINLRQDAMHNNYGNFSSSASLPLENKKVKSIAFPVNQSAAVNDPSTIIVKDGAKDITKSTVALLPVKIKGASDDYVYFAYLGRSTSNTFIMAATVAENSSNEKIAAAKEAMSKITKESTMEEAKKALELYNIAKDDEYVTESDFDSATVTFFMNTYETIRENSKPSGKISVKYYNNEKPSAEVEIYNLAEFAGKPYRVILAYYDKNGNYLSADIHSKETAEAEKETFTIIGEKCPQNAVKVKGFIWNSFDKLIPLANSDETEKKSTFKVLSIGNSYSNNAHEYLVQIAQNAGFEKVVVENLFIGGCTLDTHWKNAYDNIPAYTLYHKELVDGKMVPSTTEKVTMQEGIKNQDWDVITIQQGSSESGKSETYGNLQNIIDYVNENKTNKDAKIVWHQTWAYADDSKVLEDRYNGISQIEMYNRIISAMESEVLPLDDIDYVIPAGTAVQNARTSLGDTLTEDDAVHLNDLGCYVAGLTWLAKITGMSIDEINYVPTGITSISDNLDIIKTAVKNAIANPYAVTK